MRELDRSALTLAEFVDGGFRSYAATLGQKSREQYDWALQLHLREFRASRCSPSTFRGWRSTSSSGWTTAGRRTPSVTR